MKIIVIGFLELDALPPAITLLKILSKKNKVFYICLLYTSDAADD